MKRESCHIWFVLINLIVLRPSGSLISANMDVTFTFSVSDLVPFDSVRLLDAMSTYNTSFFKSLVQRDTFRLVDTSVVICIDGKCLDDSNKTVPQPVLPTPAPNTDNKSSLSTTVIAVIVSGCFLVLVIVIVVVIRLSKINSKSSSSIWTSKTVSNQQTNQPGTISNKLMQVEIDWPPKNLHLIKTGFKITERYPV